MKLPQCVYPSEKDCGKCSEPLKKTFNSLWFALDGRLDLDNISEDMFDEDSFRVERTPVARGGTKRRLINRLTDPNQETYFAPKEDATTGLVSGMEIIVPDSGRVCFVSKNDLTKQLLSIITETVSVATPDVTLQANYGDLNYNVNNAAYKHSFKLNGTVVLDIAATLGILTNIVPNATNTYTIGTSTRAFSTLFTRNIDTDGNNDLAIYRNSSFVFSATASTTLIQSGSNKIFIKPGSGVSGTDLDFIPDTTSGTLNLGGTSKNWLCTFTRSVDSGSNFDLSLKRNGSDRLVLGNTNNTLTGHFLTATDNTYDIGASATNWRAIYANIIDNSGSASLLLKTGGSTIATVASTGFSVTGTGDFSGAVNSNTSFKVGGTKVVGEQGAAIADPAGGATIDSEARTTINTILDRLQGHGLIAT